MKQRLIYQDDKSNKFWEVEVKGTEMVVRYGKIGTDGQGTVKKFASTSGAETAAEKAIAEKIKKGYSDEKKLTNNLVKTSKKTASGSQIKLGVFEFYLKRGLVNKEDIEDSKIEKIIDECIQLCQKKNHKGAVSKLFPILEFEMDWENCDGDAGDILIDPKGLYFKCTEKNTTLKLGVDNSNLVISASVQFEAQVKDELELDEIQEWLDENSAYAAGYVSGGWSYFETDGDNLNIIKIR